MPYAFWPLLVFRDSLDSTDTVAPVDGNRAGSGRALDDHRPGLRLKRLQHGPRRVGVLRVEQAQKEWPAQRSHQDKFEFAHNFLPPLDE